MSVYKVTEFVVQIKSAFIPGSAAPQHAINLAGSKLSAALCLGVQAMPFTLRMETQDAKHTRGKN